jgi:hypothetical protein
MVEELKLRKDCCIGKVSRESMEDKLDMSNKVVGEELGVGMADKIQSSNFLGILVDTLREFYKFLKF